MAVPIGVNQVINSIGGGVRRLWATGLHTALSKYHDTSAPNKYHLTLFQLPLRLCGE